MAAMVCRKPDDRSNSSYVATPCRQSSSARLRGFRDMTYPCSVPIANCVAAAEAAHLRELDRALWLSVGVVGELEGL